MSPVGREYKITSDNISDGMRENLLKIIQDNNEFALDAAVSRGVLTCTVDDFTNHAFVEFYKESVLAGDRTPLDSELDQLDYPDLCSLCVLNSAVTGSTRSIIYSGLSRKIDKDVAAASTNVAAGSWLHLPVIYCFPRGSVADYSEEFFMLFYPLFGRIRAALWYEVRERFLKESHNIPWVIAAVDKVSSLRRSIGGKRASVTKQALKSTRKSKKKDLIEEIFDKKSWTRLGNLRLNKLSKERFDLVKEAWLNGPPEARIHLLHIPPEYMKEHHQVLVKTLCDCSEKYLRKTLRDSNVLIITREDFDSLSVKNKAVILLLFGRGYEFLCGFVPPPDEIKNLLIALRLSPNLCSGDEAAGKELIQSTTDWYACSLLAAYIRTGDKGLTHADNDTTLAHFGKDEGDALILLNTLLSDPFEILQCVEQFTEKDRPDIACFLSSSLSRSHASIIERYSE